MKQGKRCVKHYHLTPRTYSKKPTGGRTPISFSGGIADKEDDFVAVLACCTNADAETRHRETIVKKRILRYLNSEDFARGTITTMMRWETNEIR